MQRGRTWDRSVWRTCSNGPVVRNAGTRAWALPLPRAALREGGRKMDIWSIRPLLARPSLRPPIARHAWTSPGCPSADAAPDRPAVVSACIAALGTLGATWRLGCWVRHQLISLYRVTTILVPSGRGTTTRAVAPGSMDRRTCRAWTARSKSVG